MIFKGQNAKIHYVRIGSGPPLVFLHGNGEDHRIFLVLANALKHDFTLYLVDSRHHGSSISSGAYTYDSCAEDMIELIGSLGLERPSLFGFSDGAIIGLLVAMKKPGLLSKLIVAGANLNPQGLKPTCLKAIKKDYETYARPSDLLMLTEPEITKEELKGIRSKTLVLAGEHDLVHRGHTYSIASAIPNSRLIILADHDHYDYVIRSVRLKDIIRDFLR